MNHDTIMGVAQVALYLAFADWGKGWARLNTELRRGILTHHILQIVIGKVQVDNKKFLDGSKWTADDVATVLRTCENWGGKDFSDLQMMAKPKKVSHDMTASLFED